ncbi:MAG: hypothetical protein M3P51_02160 [Chloroflexota bacterium]|nr:hypothetical protein [Chloroflexota bacterium]
MDNILLQVDNSRPPASEAVITVNGRNLIDIVREVELRFAEADWQPELAGAYGGIGSHEVAMPSRYFLGLDVDPSYGGKVPLLACSDCGMSDCWSVLVRISVDAETVVWGDFEHNHRRGWIYAAPRPLVFSRKQYESELAKLAAAWPRSAPPSR